MTLNVLGLSLISGDKSFPTEKEAEQHVAMKAIKELHSVGLLQDDFSLNTEYYMEILEHTFNTSCHYGQEYESDYELLDDIDVHSSDLTEIASPKKYQSPLGLADPSTSSN